MENFKTLLCALMLTASAAEAQRSDSVQYESYRDDERRLDIMRSREAKRRLVPGIKGGINSSNVYDVQGQGFVADPKAGFAGGAYLAIPFGGFLGIQPELLISQKGFMSTGNIQGDSYTLERTTTYLDVPLQLQLKPFRFLSILGGIQYSYLLKQNDKLVFGPNSIEHSQEFKNDNIRKNILGLVTGADINVQHIVISGRVAWDLMANRGDGSSYTPRYKNLWLQATIGYRFY